LLLRQYIQQALHSTRSTSSNSSTELRSFTGKLQALNTQPAEKSVYKYATLMMGIWYKIQGQPDQVKKWARERVLSEIETLLNRGDWFFTLAETLLYFGDKKQAAIAFAAAGASLAKPDAIKTIRQPQHCEGNAMLSLDKSLSLAYLPVSEFPYKCAGKCGRNTQTWDAYFLCEYCCLFGDYYSTSGFCGECIELVKSSNLDNDLCDRSHSFLQIYPIDVELALRGAFVTDVGQVRPRAEWLESLRREWA
jgi:hypothetical protein